jgi:hypothetical protein
VAAVVDDRNVYLQSHGRGLLFGRLPVVIKSPAGAANLWRTFAEAMRKAKTPTAATGAATMGSVPPAATPVTGTAA